MFVDASKTTYVFSCYFRCVDENKVVTNLLLSKYKNAPTKSKSVPTLELLAVFMAFTCLPSILSGLAHKNVQTIYMSVVAQIVLSSILTKNVRAKTVFASNRIKDISDFLEKISGNHDIDVRFKYISTDMNVADLVTEGISLKTLMRWIGDLAHGPTFLSEAEIAWPTAKMGCLY